jgi:hypothetical protein
MFSNATVCQTREELAAMKREEGFARIPRESSEHVVGVFVDSMQAPSQDMSTHGDGPEETIR